MQNETAKERLFRYMVIIVLFSLVVIGVRMKANQYTTLAGKNTSILQKDYNSSLRLDDTKQLTLAQEAQLYAYMERFSAVYGFTLILRIVDVPLSSEQDFISADALQGKVVFILSPKYNDVFFHAPPLVQKTLGDDFANLVDKAGFASAFADGSWPELVSVILSEMSIRLDKNIR